TSFHFWRHRTLMRRYTERFVSPLDLQLNHVTDSLVGVPGNTAVIAAFLHLIYEDTGLLTADAIVLHLACVNLLVVTVRCLLETIASFSLTNVFGDVGCKAVIFIYRTSRAPSIWLTFLLSAYQCLSITLLDLSSSNGSNLTRSAINAQFCYVNFPTEQLKETYGALQVSRDAVPMALMTLASLMILLLLYKHSQQMKGLSSSSGGGAGGGGAKQRAAKVVVVLVTMYVVLYGVDNGLWVYTLTLKQTMTSSLISDLRVRKRRRNHLSVLVQNLHLSCQRTIKMCVLSQMLHPLVN
uniref:Vomeronasal type-1 receptor n=1 Tax=Nothobranchius furzeri TaxID=105023 RepID=A0A8C6LLV3_NOTFU